ncbi:hypothetical protein Droror1_Dr00003892 [Drosera rotundifolia]
MLATAIRRLLTPLLRRPFSTTTTASLNPTIPQTRTRTLTPLDKEFESWTKTLTPGFTISDVNAALRSTSDPDLALDIFRWTAHQRNYRHDHSTYLTIIDISVSGHRIRHAETLLDEVLAGACEMNTELYNVMLRFCCKHRFMFKRAFDVYKKMYGARDEDCRPDLETYRMLFEVLLRRFNRMSVSYVYLRSVKLLVKQMKAVGVVPDTFVINMVIKAYTKCLEVDEAMRLFREMGLYGCEPNAYSYGYLIKGLCEKERVGLALRFFEEMRGKGLVPSSSTFMVLVCGLALEKRYEVAADVMLDMVGNFMSPDFLTYRTLFEEMCRDGKGDDALELLEEMRKRDVNMGERTYKSLLDSLHFPNQE